MSRLLNPRFLLALSVIIMLEASLKSALQLHSAYTFLSLLLVCYATFHWPEKNPLHVAILVGLCRDVLNAGSLGVETFCLIVTTFVLRQLVLKARRDSLRLRVVSSILFVFSNLMLHYFVISFLSGAAYNWESYLSSSFFSSLYTVLYLPVVFLLLANWFHDRIPFKQLELFKKR